MKTQMKLVVTLITFVAVLAGNAQTCLPGNNNFSQSDIDDFAIDYPNCTHILGSVVIGNDVHDLSGLNQITAIGESNLHWLRIQDNTLLTSLSGLENLTSIAGKLYLFSNNELINLDGLSGLQHIGNGISIYSNDNLETISGLMGVNSFSGDIEIGYNYFLNSLNGLNNITSANEVTIENNYLLENLQGLNSLQSVDFQLTISTSYIESLEGLDNISDVFWLIVENNPSLQNFSGIESLSSLERVIIGGNSTLNDISALENINGMELTLLNINGNENLSECDIYPFCEALSNDVYTDISYNSSGCNNANEVEQACMIGICMPDGITFTSQSDIDNFLIDYPDCTQIGGDVIIQNSTNITNLDGLANITFIGGSLIIDNNTSLVVLSEDDDSQPGFIINGLSNLTSITNDLVIKDNSNLSNLNGLSALSFVGGIIHIESNNTLASLTGLNNIGASSFGNLIITNNSSLSLCEVESICSYLDVPSNSATINNNAQGCNSRLEVETACGNIGIEDYNTVSVILYPNPTAGMLYIEGVVVEKISIYNTIGKLVKELNSINTEINLTDLSNGLYFILIEHESGSSVKSILKK